MTLEFIFERVNQAKKTGRTFEVEKNDMQVVSPTETHCVQCNREHGERTLERMPKANTTGPIVFELPVCEKQARKGRLEE